MLEDRRKWVVLFSSFVCNFLSGGISYSVGIINLGLSEAFPESPADRAAWVGTLFMGVFYLTGPFASGIINALTCRVALVVGCLLGFLGFVVSGVTSDLMVILFFFGIIASIGQSIGYTATVVITGYYFYGPKQSLATGFVVCGTATGVAVFPLLTDLLLHQYGLNGTFLLLGAITLHILVFAMCLKPHRLEKQQKKRSASFIYVILNDLKALFTNVSFLLFCLSIILLSLALNISIIYLPQFHVQTGSTHMESAMFMSVYGFCNLLSRILTGIAATDATIDPKLLYIGSFTIMALSVSLLPVYGTFFLGKLVYSVVLGLYTSGTFATMTSIDVEIVGITHMSTAYGFQLLALGIGVFLCPIIAGNILDATGEFTVVFIVSGALYFGAVVLGVLMVLTMDSTKLEEIQRPEDREIEIENNDSGPQKQLLQILKDGNVDMDCYIPEQDKQMLQKRSKTCHTMNI